MHLPNTKDTSGRGNQLNRARSFSSPREFIWLILLLLSSLVFSLGFACATPLAAFAAIAAVALSTRDGLILSGGVWLVNQIVGYTILKYPCTVNSVSWGLVLGATTIVTCLASRWVYRNAKTGYLVRLLAAFIAAFSVFEVILYAAAVFALGGVEDSTPDIMLRVLAINAAAFCGLLALHWLAITVGFISVATNADSSHPTPAHRPAV